MQYVINMRFILAFSNDEGCLLCLNDELPLNGFAVLCWLVGDYLSRSGQAMRLPSWSKHLRNATVRKLNMSGTQQASVFFMMAEKQMSCHLYQPVPALLRDVWKLCSRTRVLELCILKQMAVYDFCEDRQYIQYLLSKSKKL